MGPSAGSGEAHSCGSHLCPADKTTQILDNTFCDENLDFHLISSEDLAMKPAPWLMLDILGHVHSGALLLPTDLSEQWAESGIPQLPHPHHVQMPPPPTRGKLSSTAACSQGLTSITSPQKLHLGTLARCTSCKLLVPPPTASDLHRSFTRDHKIANHRSRSHHLSQFCIPAPQTTQSPTEFKRSPA